MEFLTSSLLLLLLTLSLIQFIARRNRSTVPGRKLPPGPPGLPVIGNLLDLGDQPHKSLAKLARTRGPLMSLRLGQVTTVVISSPEMAREVLQKHDLVFSNRTVIDAARALGHHEYGMPWLPVDTLWRNLRKVSNSYVFTPQKLDANRGLRRKKLEDLIGDVRASCEAGKVIHIGQVAFNVVVNAMSNTVFSYDLAGSSSDSGRDLKELFRAILVEAGKPNLSDYFPLLRRVDLQGIRRRVALYFGKVLDLFDRVIKERIEARESGGYITANDMLDTLLDIKEDGVKLDMMQIKHLLLVLFVAGSDTTTSTLEWAMAEVLKHPKVLAKARSELEQTVGKGNIIDESDITRLPYLQAIIKETFRLHPAVPLLLPRKARADVELHGFTVPKDAQVLINAWAIGRDPRTWKDPDSFLPERFLGSDIDARGHHFELIPFGGGRRICPGLPLAVRMLHLILGSLINSFDWKLEDGVTPENMDMEDKFGISLQKAKPLRAVPVSLI